MNRFFLIFLTLFSSIHCLSAKAKQNPQPSIPPPYNYIHILPFDNGGWYVNGSSMEKIFHAHHITTVIEVGSWLGLSTRHIAKLLPPKGKVYAIDHWLGSSEHQEGQPCWAPALPHLYQQFLSNVIHENLTNKIIPIRMNSIEASKALNVVPDLIYIDAGHETEAVYEDLKAWYPFVKGHGILCGDDWTWPSVQVAVSRFATENNLKIESDYNFWRLCE